MRPALSITKKFTLPHYGKWFGGSRTLPVVYGASFSDDSSLLATWNEAGVRVWNLATGRTIQRYRNKGGYFIPWTSLLFTWSLSSHSPSPGDICTVGNRTALWSVETASAVAGASVNGHRLVLYAQRRLEGNHHWGGPSGPDAAQVQVHETTTGRLLLRLPEYRTDSRSLAYSPDGRLLAIAGYGRQCECWDIDSGTVVCAFDLHALSPLQAVFSGDSEWLAINTGSRETAVIVYNVRTGEVAPLRLPEPPGTLFSLFATPKTTGILLVESNAQQVRVWNVVTQSIVAECSGFNTLIHTENSDVSLDGQWLAVNAGATLCVRNLVSGATATVPTPLPTRQELRDRNFVHPGAVQWSPDAQLLCSGIMRDARLQVWSVGQ